MAVLCWGTGCFVGPYLSPLMTGKARAELAVLLSVLAVPVFLDCGVVLHALMISAGCVLAPVAAFVTATL